jgi:hypothetical protein
MAVFSHLDESAVIDQAFISIKILFNKRGCNRHRIFYNSLLDQITIPFLIAERSGGCNSLETAYSDRISKIGAVGLYRCSDIIIIR